MVNDKLGDKIRDPGDLGGPPKSFDRGYWPNLTVSGQ